MHTQASENVPFGIGERLSLFKGHIRSKLVLQAPFDQLSKRLSNWNLRTARRASHSSREGNKGSEGCGSYHVLPDEFLEFEHDTGPRGKRGTAPFWEGLFCCLHGCVELPSGGFREP